MFRGQFCSAFVVKKWRSTKVLCRTPIPQRIIKTHFADNKIDFADDKVNKSEIKNRVREKSPIKLRGRLTNSASGRHGWTGPSGPRRPSIHPSPYLPCFATFKLLCTRAFRRQYACIQFLPAIFIQKKSKRFFNITSLRRLSARLLVNQNSAVQLMM